MKNLKKVLALVVALTMVLGTVGFAAYTDVAVDADEYTAVSTLSSLGILTGYEDGSFKPEGDITRAEFCAVVCRLLGAKVAGSSATNFSDVPAEHWASAYIAHVAGLGIVNGMGDGTFAPDANVTYEQAVKMLVVALGYEPAAASKGGYPTGYMVVANTEGVTDGISAAQSAPASRGVVAQLAFNALDVPMMIQDGYGTQVSFKKADGKQLPYQTFLSDLGVAKLDGTVTATSKIGGAEAGEVEFTVAADGVYDSENFKFKANNSYDFVVGEGVNAEDYFQVDTTIYVRELKKGDFEIIAVMAGEDNESIELDYEVIESASATQITYNETGYSNDDEDLAINSGATWYFNNNIDASAASYVDAFVNSAAMQTAKDLKVTVIENDGKKGYDAVIVKEYEYDLVSEVEADKDRFYATNNVGTFAFDFEDEDKLISIVDKDGNAMKLADFAENDVIAYMYGGGNGLSDYTWIEVINYGQNAVTGAVNEKDGDALYIDGTEYANVSGGVIGLGEEGTFFLTASGKIFAYEISASVASNYGYILATGELASNGATTSSVWQVRMLTKDNEIVLFNVKDGYTPSIITSLDVNVGSNGDTGAFKTDVDKRLVTYKLNSKNEIIEVNAVIDNAANSAAGAYNASTGKLFGKYVEGATIFNIDVTQATSAFVTTSASFVDDNNYKGYAIANANGKYDCFLITEGGNEIDYTQNLAVVAGVRTTNIDSIEALKVTYYVAGETEAKEIVIMNDTDVSAPLTISAGSETVDPSVYGKVKQGAIMMFSDNGNGVASAYAVLANVAYGAANSAASVAYTNTDLINYINNNANLETQIAVTYIDSYERKNGINITFGGGVGELALERGTACYTIDNATSASKSKITVGDWQATGIDKKIGDKANMAIVRVVDGSLVDLITLSAR